MTAIGRTIPPLGFALMKRTTITTPTPPSLIHPSRKLAHVVELGGAVDEAVERLPQPGSPLLGSRPHQQRQHEGRRNPLLSTMMTRTRLMKTLRCLISTTMKKKNNYPTNPLHHQQLARGELPPPPQSQHPHVHNRRENEPQLLHQGQRNPRSTSPPSRAPRELGHPTSRLWVEPRVP